MIKNVIIGLLGVFGLVVVIINIDIYAENQKLKAENLMYKSTVINYNEAYNQLKETNKQLQFELQKTKIMPPQNLRIIPNR